MNRYLKIALLLLLHTTVIYHLIDYDNYPFSPNYRFPLRTILFAFIVGLFLAVPIEWYFKRLFSDGKTPKKSVVAFIRNTFLVMTLVFVTSYFIFTRGEWNSYYVIVSFLLTVVNSAVWMTLIYGKTLLLKWTKLEGSDTLTIKSGDSIHKVTFGDLSHFSSMNKVVIAHLKSGKQIITNFNLTELQNLLPNLFFRINRQFILNREVVQGIRRLENQKLEVLLKGQETKAPLIVSRYRASDFKKWIE